ncbi:MAG: metalloregulator ArsR/SmtB family transcription factor [Bacteroidales bacterium]|jgi:ArsR family transcriptional regulator|nr:metalloregulator ArsR/SmtB family transcription factor [Bacteroidales bacterium]
MKIDTEKTDVSQEVKDMATICKAMAHPVRVHILQKLSGMNACCYSGDLVDELPVGRSTLSKHLKELKYAGLIQGEIEPPYIKYCINRENWLKAKKLILNLFDESKPAGDMNCTVPSDNTNIKKL